MSGSVEAITGGVEELAISGIVEEFALTGSVEEFAGLQTYITGPRDCKRAIVLLSDAVGFEVPNFSCVTRDHSSLFDPRKLPLKINVRKLADKVAKAGFLVVAPDFFYGDPLDVHNPQADRVAWMKAHDAAKGCEDAKAVIEALKNMGVTAIGAAGFCWGGMVAVKLAKYDDLVKAVVILHPGPITDDEMKEVRVPTALLGAEEDHVFSAEQLTHVGVILASNTKVESMTKTYPGTKHGWTLMYKTDDEAAVKNAEEAHTDMLNWLNRRVEVQREKFVEELVDKFQIPLQELAMPGRVEEFAGLQTYITGPRDSKRAIVLLSDAVGFEAPNFRKLADKVAQAGFFVVAPDFFNGDPLDVQNPQADRVAWMKAHDAAKGFEDAKAVIEALKNMGVTAIGAAGFCWGGMVAVKLAKYDDLVKTVVILHPGPITDDEMKEVKVAVALLGAEEDHLCSPEQLIHLGVLASRARVECLTKIYPGTKHGWTLMYKTDDEAAVKIAEEAHKDMLYWLNRRV